MATVVVNCFHWIGFHFVEMLLERGEEVIGVHKDASEKAIFISMFLARNSLFTYKTEMPSTAEKTIVVGHTNNFPESTSIIHLFYDEEIKSVDKFDHENIQMPLLYGEWMPMNEKGMCVHNTQILYESERFMEEAEYVRNFIKRCLTVFDEKVVNNKGVKSNKNKGLILENNAHFRDNRTKKENIEKMQKHYLRYASLYYE